MIDLGKLTVGEAEAKLVRPEILSPIRRSQEVHSSSVLVMSLTYNRHIVIHTLSYVQLSYITYTTVIYYSTHVDIAFLGTYLPSSCLDRVILQWVSSGHDRISTCVGTTYTSSSSSLDVVASLV